MNPQQPSHAPLPSQLTERVLDPPTMLRVDLPQHVKDDPVLMARVRARRARWPDSDAVTRPEIVVRRDSHEHEPAALERDREIKEAIDRGLTRGFSARSGHPHDNDREIDAFVRNVITTERGGDRVDASPFAKLLLRGMRAQRRRKRLVRIAWGLAGFLAFTLLVGLLGLMLAGCGQAEPWASGSGVADHGGLCTKSDLKAGCYTMTIPGGGTNCICPILTTEPPPT